MFNYSKYIVKLLKREQEGHPILKHFLIKFPDFQVAQSDNCIFVGFSEAKAINQTHHSQTYQELIDIVITSKNQDYYESAKIYDTVTDIILEILRRDDFLKDKMNVISYMYKYNQNNTLQFGELLVSFKNVEDYREVFNMNDDKLIADIVYSIKGYADE